MQFKGKYEKDNDAAVSIKPSGVLESNYVVFVTRCFFEELRLILLVKVLVFKITSVLGLNTLANSFKAVYHHQQRGYSDEIRAAKGLNHQQMLEEVKNCRN